MTTNQPVDLALVRAYLHNLQLALAAGGLDNIGLVVVRVRIDDISELQTIITPRERILLSA